MDHSVSILIAGASDYMRNYILKGLNHQGYHKVIEAVDGKNALDLLMEHKVGLIILELEMPKVSGLELVKALANHSGLNHIPRVILTPDESDGDFKQAMETGVAGFLKKPFTSSELDALIKSI